MSNKDLLYIEITICFGIAMIGIILMLMLMCQYDKTRKMLRFYTLFFLKLLNQENLICLISRFISKDKYDSGVYIPLNYYFIYDREKNEIRQKLTKGYELNNLINRRKILSKISDISSDKRKYLSHKVITLTTNKVLYIEFYRKNKKIIKSIKKSKVGDDNQCMERLRLIDGKVLRKSVFDKELRNEVKNFLYKEVEIYTYTIELI